MGKTQGRKMLHVGLRVKHQTAMCKKEGLCAGTSALKTACENSPVPLQCNFTRAHACASTRVYEHTHVCTCMNTCVHTRTHTCMSVRTVTPSELVETEQRRLLAGPGAATASRGPTTCWASDPRRTPRQAFLQVPLGLSGRELKEAQSLATAHS